MATKGEQLRKEIEQKRLELEQLEKSEAAELRCDAIKDITEFSDAEKIEVFNRIYNFASSTVEAAERNGCDEDDEHYAYETVMEVNPRKGIFYFTLLNTNLQVRL